MNFRNKLSIVLGIFIIILTSVSIASSSSISPFGIFLLFFSLFLILDGILHHKTAILYIFFGFVIVICTIIWAMVNKIQLSSFEVIICIIGGIISLIVGIFVLLGYLSERWIHA